MTVDCKDLQRFLDGQMQAREQGRFRQHLGGCGACEARFRESMQLELLAHLAQAQEVASSDAPAPSAPAERRARRTWLRGLRGLEVLVAGVAVWMLLPFSLPWGGEQSAWLSAEGPRVLEGRVTYRAVDAHHRPYVPDRGADAAQSPVPSLPLQDLWRMEARGDLHGVATAYLLHGAPRQAQAFLKRMPASADRDCDLALLALEQARQEGSLDTRPARLEEALELLSGVLREWPRHPQALWNRALALSELGLPLLAADAFGEVARLGEPGWREEAAQRERVLRESTSLRARAWKDAYASVRELVTDSSAPLPLAAAREHPGILRLGFYDAVRAAPSREAVLRLEPLARVLDERYGGSVLRTWLARVAERDFTHRGPLARLYGRLVMGSLAPAGEVLETLRRSGEEDLYLGALVLADSQRQPVDSQAVIRLARASGDPWMRVLADQEQAKLWQREGQWWKAEQRLLDALDTCQKQGLVYRCLGLQRRLADLYLDQHRPAEAFQHAWKGWARALEAREWRFEQEFLQELADVARYQHAFTTARAYLEESLGRMPEDCAQRTHVHRTVALLEWQRFRPEAARAALERAMECERPLGLTGAWVLSEMARSVPRPQDGALLRRALADLRRGPVSPGLESLLLVIEGQFLLAQPGSSGRELVHRALSMADLEPDSVDARKARAFGYSALLSEAGRTGAWDEALTLMAHELRVEPVAQRCLLAVSVQHERTLVLVRGPLGELKGAYSTGRQVPLRDEATGLVPAELVKELSGCDHVDVLTRPPVHGLAGLLPDSLAWSYRVGRGARGVPARTGPSTHLVVTEVASPPSLRLSRLAPLTPPRVPDPWRVELRGAEATASRVLSEMAQASEVELHTHGLFSASQSDASMVVLAPEADGSYVLTVDKVRQARLSHAPLVLLATCGAARTAPFPHESFSLPMAFIEAGASAVLAASVEIPDSAGAFFERVRERIRAGERPSVALRDLRASWLLERPDDARWLSRVLLFE
ncbi:CHAT domain-containing protein [Myxococcus sp. XM-1-1-1]|uniref:CHAT domain-containing protein n=1 Tax=Myxococcus sp. XM-1-1-1 TaxID=2874602 RepID=UPI001CBDAE04|nr:CHAT domain-containing protein [Myxococcus sp. XM-1-1-1]MBZ4407095.1 CHAT domain-containing protein [Myxococcus sp. XM-1-1-1]